MSEARVRRGISLVATWGAVAVLVPTAVTAFIPTQALDLAYQLRAGAEMMASRDLMRTDTFTYTVHGAPWLNQQWGAQILLASAHPGDGWLGLGLVRVVAVAVTMFLVFRSCRSLGAGVRVAAGMTVAAWFVAATTIAQLRPQTFAIVLFASSAWLVVTRTRGRRRLWLVPLITVLWVNVHGSFPLVLVWLGVAMIDDLAGGRRGDALVTASIAAVSVVAMSVNPFGLEIVTYVADLVTDPVVSERVGEWGAPSLTTLTGLLFWTSLAGVVLVVARRHARLSVGSMVGLAVFAVGAIVAVRGVVWWALAVPILMSPAVAARDPVPETRPDRSVVGFAIVAVLVGLTVVGVVRGTHVDPRTRAPSMLSFAPGRLVDALRDTVPPGSRVFASQLHASWAEYAADGYLYAVDSRIELFPDRVWREYFAISDGREGWEVALDRSEVEAVLLDPSQAPGLLVRIGDDPGWRLVLETDEGALFVRA
jgi:hypothetical protein